MTQTRIQRLLPFLSLLFLGVALYLLHRLAGRYNPRHIAAALRELSAWRIALSLLFTGGAYAAAVAYDILATRYVARPLPLRRVTLSGFSANAVSMALGQPLLTSTPLRFRLYGAAGYTAIDTAKLALFVSSSFWLGWAATTGVLLTAGAGPPVGSVAASRIWLQAVGALALALILAYIVATVRLKEPLRIRDWQVGLPSPGLAVGQVLAGAADWICTALALYVLVPHLGVTLVTFLTCFLLAQVAGLISHVPAGLGVLDAALILLLGGDASTPHLLGGLLAFRAIYYLLPLAAAVLLLVLAEARARRARLAALAERSQEWLGPLVPAALATLTFTCGALLLVSGAVPVAARGMQSVGRLLPLPIFELSHLVSSLIGTGLLILARGLQRRLDSAYYLTLGLLLVALVVSILELQGWSQPLSILLLLGLLWVGRKHFHRRSTLHRPALSGRWVLAIGLVLLLWVALGLFANRQVDYSSELWWRFSLNGDAPRFLRASFAVATLLAVVALARLLRAATPEAAQTTPESLLTAGKIAEQSEDETAQLVHLGDKHILLSDERNAFIMYGVAGDSWVAMGDPVGPAEEWPELVWRYREACDHFDGEPVFYRVGPETLALYLDVGLTAFKLGESARVDLESFGLAGGARRGLRRTKRDLDEAGLRVEIQEPPHGAELLATLRSISDSWLQEKNAREKRFSLGWFDERYLDVHPVALVRDAEGAVLAFANLLRTGGREVLTADLMRYLPNAPPSIMEGLFIEVMLWGREQGYRSFSLGMAPLAGLEDHALAPLWNRIGGFIFRYGEHFYNFRGLRDYKEKFDPVWEPRYLTCRNARVLPGVLWDTATLISGGSLGLVSR